MYPGLVLKEMIYPLFDFLRFAHSILEYISGSIEVTMALIEDLYTLKFIVIFHVHFDILY